MKNPIAKPKLATVPLSLAEANEFVRRHHRHHRPVVGHKFSIGAVLGDRVVGVAIVGRPVSRHRDDGLTLEVTRLYTDGTPNACSYLDGEAWRAAKALGFKRLETYDWRMVAEVRGRSWSTPSRPRVDTHPLGQKLLWEVEA